MQTEVPLQAVPIRFLPAPGSLATNVLARTCPAWGRGAEQCRATLGFALSNDSCLLAASFPFVKGQAFHFLLQTVIFVSPEYAWCQDWKTDTSACSRRNQSVSPCCLVATIGIELVTSLQLYALFMWSCFSFSIGHISKSRS